jgi:hypothetical protein
MPLPPLTSTFVRRIALLCCHFTRNLAYYRLGYVDENGLGQLKQATEFGATINGNMVDIAVLEWCKLFADRKGHHHWNRLVRPDVEQRQFLAELLHILEVNEAAWRQYLDEFRVYRDKFVAHLDTDESARIPQLDMACKAPIFSTHVYSLTRQLVLSTCHDVSTFLAICRPIFLHARQMRERHMLR